MVPFVVAFLADGPRACAQPTSRHPGRSSSDSRRPARARSRFWIEKADGTVPEDRRADTGGQPSGASAIARAPMQMNSGFHWPYGRREGRCPSGRTVGPPRRARGSSRASSFRTATEGFASRTCEDSTPESYFCLAFIGDQHARPPSTRSAAPAALSATRDASSSGVDVAAGYAEPVEIAAARPCVRCRSSPSIRLGATSSAAPIRPLCRPGVRGCNDCPDVSTYDAEARAAMPDIDAVTMATPPADEMEQSMFSIPRRLDRRGLRRLDRGEYRGRLQPELQRYQLPDPRRGRTGTAGR